MSLSGPKSGPQRQFNAFYPAAPLAEVGRAVRRMRPMQALWVALSAILALQLAVIAILSVIGRRRRLRAPKQGFPRLPGGEVPVADNALTLYASGGELFDAMLRAISSAREVIYFETYIWKADQLGHIFKNALIAKANEGVRVYVIFDNFGNLVVPDAFKRFPDNIHVLKYSAIKRPWHLFDPRRYALDHRKLLIVDDKVGFIGGYNIGSLYATQWRDTHIRISGPDALDLAYAFVDFWNRFSVRKDVISRHYNRRFDPTIDVHSNDALRLTFPIRNTYIEAIERAQSHIYLTNAYFVPDHVLLEALTSAAQRGVDVQVLLPWTSNHIVADWVARSYFTRCLQAGVRIFGYQDAMIHAKTCTVDGVWSTVGTANLDRLSSVGNFEINVVVYDDHFARQMESLFAADKTNAFELTAEKWLRRPWYVKLSERVLEPLRYLV
jgi:cardiolipin synthase A/B